MTFSADVDIYVGRVLSSCVSSVNANQVVKILNIILNLHFSCSSEVAAKKPGGLKHRVKKG